LGWGEEKGKGKKYRYIRHMFLFQVFCCKCNQSESDIAIDVIPR